MSAMYCEWRIGVLVGNMRVSIHKTDGEIEMLKHSDTLYHSDQWVHVMHPHVPTSTALWLIECPRSGKAFSKQNIFMEKV